VFGLRDSGGETVGEEKGTRTKKGTAIKLPYSVRGVRNDRYRQRQTKRGEYMKPIPSGQGDLPNVYIKGKKKKKGRGNR